METTEEIVLAVIMPAYNQETTIEQVIDEWIAALTGLGVRFRLHVYNDGSTDATPALLNRLAGTHEALHLYHQANAGHGPTILQGYRENAHATWIFQVDSDDEVSAAHFEAFWQQRHAYDFIIAHRKGRKASVSRKLLSWAARSLIHLLYGGAVHDVNVPYRLLRTEAFQPCFSAIPEHYFAPNLAITGYAALHDLKTLERTVPHRSRVTGDVTRSSWRILKGSLLALGQTIALRFSANLPPGVLSGRPQGPSGPPG